MNDTICALATAPGRAAVAVVRLSGARAGEILESLSHRTRPKARQASVRRLFTTQGKPLDEALVLYFSGPASFTGEDVVELHLHGGRAVVSGVMAALLELGARAAGPGEFTRRAFENGKLSLAEAEGVADLVDAESEAQRLQALGQLSGEMDRRFETWRESLLHALAQVEAAIDFPDEEIPETVTQDLRLRLEALERDLDAALHDQRGEAIREGYKVALIGAPNAGKSSLFNALVRRDAAIVTEIAGTTRDLLEAPLVLGGYSVLLSDTAGLRETGDVVEREGVVRARRGAAAADLRLWVIDTSQPLDAEARSAEEFLVSADWIIENKADVSRETSVSVTLDALPNRRFLVSAQTGLGVEELRNALVAQVAATLGGAELPATTRARHKALLGAALDDLRQALKSFHLGAEFIGEDLRLTARHLERMSGRIDSEDVLSRVFSSFCIGK